LHLDFDLNMTFTFLFSVTTVFVRPLISFSILENLESMTDIWSLSVRIWELLGEGRDNSVVLCSLSSRWENWEFCSRRKWLVRDWKFPDFSQSKKVGNWKMKFTKWFSLNNILFHKMI
jgi:hypothetical protein